jgi:hypothetical protein
MDNVKKQNKRNFSEEQKENNLQVYLKIIRKNNLKNLQRLAISKKKDKDKLMEIISRKYTFPQLQQIAIQKQELSDVYSHKEKEYKIQNRKQIKSFIKHLTPTVNTKPKIHKFKHDNEISSYIIHKYQSKKGQYTIFNTVVDFYPLTVSTTPHITSYISQLMKEKTNQMNIKYKQGYILKCKMVISDIESEQWGSIVFDYKDPDTKIEVDLSKLANKQYATVDYIMYVREFEILVSKLSKAGGCSKDKKSEQLEKKFDWMTKRTTTIKIHSLKSTNNNCLLQCFNNKYEVNGNVMKCDTVRKDLGIPLGSIIEYSNIPKISEYYNKRFKKDIGYCVMNAKQEFISVGGNVKDYVQLFLRNDHYYLFDYINHRICKECGEKLRDENSTHKCNIERVSYHNRIIKEENNLVKVQNVRDKELIDYNRVVTWDLETFQHTNRHEAYASGWKVDGVYKVEYGQNCIEKTIDEFCTYKNRIVSAFNGSGFDFYFLLDKLTERGVCIKNLIINGGKLMSFEFGDGNKIFDLYLFITSSLDKACKDFKIINAKTSFDHSLIKTFEDVETYKETVLPYLKLDVLALEELFIKFNDLMFEKFKLNITKYLTISSMGYEIWSMLLKEIVEIPTCMDKYDWIMKSKYGGRTTCHQKQFVSKTWTQDLLPKVIDGSLDSKIAYAKLKESGDYIFNADVSSLYPASMKGNDLMKVYYPVGRSHWTETPDVDFKLGKIGFYSIEFTCPNDIRIPILPRRKLKNGHSMGVEWSLNDGAGVYTSVDIQNALDSGYTVKFVDRALVYDEKSESIFTDYINTFYKLKQDAERENNPVLRTVAKLFLNALYGKTLQKAIFTTNTIANNANEFNDFTLKYRLTSWKFLSNSKLLLTGESIVKEKRISKPCQLGAFVTAYSRRLMLIFMKAIDPTLRSIIQTYGDTDSMHIYGKDHKKLVEMGLIKDKERSELGYLNNDIDDDSLIIYEQNLAPKSYRYDHVNNKGIVKDKNCGVMKMKGIPKRYLQANFYDAGVPEVVKIEGLKRKNMVLTKADVQNEVKHFSIVNYKMDRTFYANTHDPENFKDNQWYPAGYLP